MCTSVKLANWKWISEHSEEVKVLDGTFTFGSQAHSIHFTIEKASNLIGMPILAQIRHRMTPVPGMLQKV
jgi:hypothetical protein